MRGRAGKRPALLVRAVRCAATLAGALGVAACVHETVIVNKPSTTDAAAYNLQLGVAYMQQGNLALAKDKLERSVKENDSDPKVHTALALLYERLGKPNLVDSEYRAALRLAPQDPDIANAYGVHLCGIQRFDEGVRHLVAAARNPLYRTPEVAWTNAGVCLRTAHRDSDALADLQQAVEIRPTYAEATFQLADTQLALGRIADARTLVERYLGSNSATPELLMLGVRISRALGDRIAAERYARRLRTDFPDSEQARALSANSG